MDSDAMQEAIERETARLDCIHCGLCLSACPTYRQIGSEVDSPRGRIYLINAMAEGRIAPNGKSFERHMFLCLECRACESACPSGVQFSVMMNQARAGIVQNKVRSRWESFFRRLVFRALLPNRSRLHLLFRHLRLYQKSGIQKLVRSSGILKLLPKRLEIMEGLLPQVPKSPTYRLPPEASGKGRYSASLFEGCIMPELFGPVNEATVRVLERNGVLLCSPPRQTCCGALHLHDGELDVALDLARKNIDAFEGDGADHIVVNAAGCGVMLKEYGFLLRDDSDYANRARAFSRRVKDVTEFLDWIGIDKDMGRLELKVTYDDPCHLIHGQRIKDPPRSLLEAIPGVQLIDLTDADRCCGSAGIYNITHPEMSAKILAEKLDRILESGADVVASGNPGCLLQISQGLHSRNVPLRTAHPVELLDEAYRLKDRGAD